MLFQRPLSFFVAATSLASSATAFAILGQRDNTCSTGPLRCCDSATPFLSLPDLDRAALLNEDPNVNTSLFVGIGCEIFGTQTCQPAWYCTPWGPVFD
ncbi:hypothetical protein EI94DRAFT_1738129 [Lactarius quietus]|nr:hypothetical protein EI94DRAFT_1738129 [Lactarius quietus]